MEHLILQEDWVGGAGIHYIMMIHVLVNKSWLSTSGVEQSQIRVVFIPSVKGGIAIKCDIPVIFETGRVFGLPFAILIQSTLHSFLEIPISRDCINLEIAEPRRDEWNIKLGTR